MARMGNRTSSTCWLEKEGSKQAIFLCFSWHLERIWVGGREADGRFIALYYSAMGYFVIWIFLGGGGGRNGCVM